MATLTSTVSITGVVSGRRISISHTCTVPDVYDAGLVVAEGVAGTVTYAGTAGTVTLPQGSPSFVFVKSNTPSTPSIVRLNMASDNDDVIVGLAGGQMLILHEYEGGAGVAAIGVSQTALEEVTAIAVDPVPNFQGPTSHNIMVANVAST
jgi:hypothetical protein